MTVTPNTSDTDKHEETQEREAERKALALHVHLCRLAEEARECGLEYASLLIDAAARSCIDKDSRHPACCTSAEA